MKQIFAALTALTLLCTLTACGGMADQSASAPSPSDQKELLSESGTSSTPDEREPAAAETPRVLVTPRRDRSGVTMCKPENFTPQ